MSAEDTINRDSNKLINNKETTLIIDNSNERNLIIFNENHENVYKLIEMFGDFVIYEYFRLLDGESEDIEKYIDYLKQDLLVTLLYESIENINGYFDTVKKHKVYRQLSTEFYFESEEDFKKEVEGFWGKDTKYSNLFEGYYKELFNKVPRILFIWYMFAGRKLIEKTSKEGTSINKLIDPRKLPLFNFKNKKVEILNDAKTDINFFMKELYINKKLNINVSVNLFAFNKVTNLFDLYVFLNKGYKLKVNYLDVEAIANERIYFFESNASVINLSGLKMRKYLIDFDIYNNKYFAIKERIEKERDLFHNLKNTIKQKIIENINLEYDIKIPEEIRNDYILYIKLKQIDYYKDLIKTFDFSLLEGSDSIYDQLEAVYNALYSEKKRKKDLYKSMEPVEHMELSAKNKKRKTLLDLINDQKN